MGRFCGQTISRTGSRMGVECNLGSALHESLTLSGERIFEWGFPLTHISRGKGSAAARSALSCAQDRTRKTPTCIRIWRRSALSGRLSHLGREVGVPSCGRNLVELLKSPRSAALRQHLFHLVLKQEKHRFTFTAKTWSKLSSVCSTNRRLSPDIPGPCRGPGSCVRVTEFVSL